MRGLKFQEIVVIKFLDGEVKSNLTLSPLEITYDFLKLLVFNKKEN